MLYGNINCLPSYNLLFLADPTEYGNAKIAIDLRDSAGERCVGEMAVFFISGGPLGVPLAITVLSVVCATTIMFAQATTLFEYHRFLQQLLGLVWMFWVVYMLPVLTLGLHRQWRRRA